MKKPIFLLCLLSFILPVTSQVTLNNPESQYLQYDKAPADVSVYIINGIKPTSALQYWGSAGESSYVWYKYKGGVKTNYASNTNDGSNYSEIQLDYENAAGYILEVDGAEKAVVWIIDYQNFLPDFSSAALEPVLENSSCDGIILKLNPSSTVPALSYQKPQSAAPYPIDRTFTLTYETREWNDSWSDKEEKKQVVLPKETLIRLSAPLKDTKFTLSGDEFAERLEIDPLPTVQLETSPYVGIESRMKAFLIVRDATNEVERPKEDAPNPPINGSAPLQITIEGNSSDPNNTMYTWQIYKGKEVWITRTEEKLFNVFSEAGSYKVKLHVENGTCAYTDSIDVNVSESLLEVPNVFTPNGDGVNDEFKVVFRSLESFHCWVYNNWGKLIYEWTDPTKGWDGRINGKNAAMGPYFYVIKAKGTDGVKYEKKGDINLIR
ncbi:gliding motility-associated C-terminal domain-containing protein [Paludibacter sp. 221]|uniref:gliding motility-associated C-terminal domain-containing protein n=1 Tax=Paludibacter sp. 221 TaxID=2302939 RepID=UPI0013D4BD54|nr:gliding motility-associated C-terminal domain-containing protein [Paludibacter sp. 221]NDV45873.1 gliding motility-associated C-terminal domain-containing protein [Paludibacter sp. 221]